VHPVRQRLTPSPGSPLASGDFRRLWIGEAVSIAGTQFHFVALPWVVLAVTGSGLALGGVLTAAAIPRAAFMLLGGAMTDRLSPRRLMLLSNLTRAVFAGLLALAILADRTPLILLYLVSGLFGLADAVFYPAYTALVPRVVPGPSLAAANSLIQGTAHTVGLVVPAAAGVVIAAAGPATAFGVDAASFLFAAAMLSGIRGGGVAPTAAAPGVLGAIAGGVAYVRSHPHARTLLLAIAVLNLAFVGPFIVGGTALARDTFPGGAAALGWLFSALAGGALAGTAMAPTLDRRGYRPGLLVLFGMVIIGTALALLSVVSSAPQACVVVALAGLAAGSLNPLILSWLQRATPAPLQGRVMSLAMLGGVGLTPVSFVVAGILVEYGPATLFLSASALLVGASLGLAPILRRDAGL
jgi:MFS family permease